MTCILTTLCRQHTASHQYHQSCYYSNDSQSSKNTNKGRLGASLPPGHKMEAELSCPLNTWHEGWKKQTHFSLPHICGILIKMHNIAEMLVGYCVGKFSSATPNQNNTNVTTNETHQQKCRGYIQHRWFITSMLYGLLHFSEHTKKGKVDNFHEMARISISEIFTVLIFAVIDSRVWMLTIYATNWANV